MKLFENTKQLIHRWLWTIVFISLLNMIVITPSYSQLHLKESTIKNFSTVEIEKGQFLVVPVYLDSSNPSEEIKNMTVSISFDENILDAVAIQVHNGILSDYFFYDILQMDGKAIVRINGSGQMIQQASVVEFLFNPVKEGTTNVSIDTFTCNDYNVSGGFWVNENFFQSIYVKVTEPDVFHISFIEDQTIFEDQPLDPIQFTINVPGGYTSGFIAISAVSSNNQLIPQRNMSISGVGTERYLYIIPATNEFGNADISVSAVYGFQKDIRTFSINVTPVNDPPSFTVPSSIEIPETSGYQFFTNWAQQISKGPENEFEQSLEFIISVDKPSLFSKLPEIDSKTGNLTFFPMDNLSGNAIVSVYLKDNAGTENGGINICSPQHFALIIVPFSPTLSDNPVDHLIFISSNHPISTQKVSPYIRIVACDEYGKPVAMESDVQIWLGTDGSEYGWFYVKGVEWSWQQTDAVIVIPKGECSALFKYRNAQPGKWTVTASEIPDKGWFEAQLTVHVLSEASGDINRDGVINLEDLIIGLQIISGIFNDISYDIVSADLSGNEIIDLEEIIYIIQYISIEH